MRSMANTSISFGLVNVPVKMNASTESHDLLIRAIREQSVQR